MERIVAASLIAACVITGALHIERAIDRQTSIQLCLSAIPILKREPDQCQGLLK